MACGSAVVEVSLVPLEPVVVQEVEEASAQRRLSCFHRSVRLPEPEARPGVLLQQRHHPNSLVKLRPVALAYLPSELPTQQLLMKLCLLCLRSPAARPLVRQPSILGQTSQARSSSSHIRHPWHVFAQLRLSNQHSPSCAVRQPLCNQKPHGPCHRKCYT